MKILAIETSCDETAVTILEATGDEQSAEFTVLGNALISQIDIHREFGGVYPAVAKREHAKNLVPILHESLAEAGLLIPKQQTVSDEDMMSIRTVLEREPELADAFVAFLAQYDVPSIDAIAVTQGPGLAPALWVGVNFARVLATHWQKPLVGVNHMEGHLLSALSSPSPTNERAFSMQPISLPLLGLLISGGHTEIVCMDSWLSYRLMGATKDDAVGEAYDKVARMLGLLYPGGPEVSRLAEQARARGSSGALTLPRPMLHDGSHDFSFSGLKTAVLYHTKGRTLTETEKEDISLSFEDAVADVLRAKTLSALEATNAQTLTLGGGVSANSNIRRVFTDAVAEKHPEVSLHLPEFRFTTDNAIMIGIAGFYHARAGRFISPEALSADGNLSLT